MAIFKPFFPSDPLLVTLVFSWNPVHCKLDLADTDLAENLGLKDTLQKELGNHFWFLVHISPLKVAEYLDLVDKRVVTDYSAISSFHCTRKKKPFKPKPL